MPEYDPTVPHLRKATQAQKHGAQSECFMRSTSPQGVFAKAAPSIFQNEERFTAAHALNGRPNPKANRKASGF